MTIITRPLTGETELANKHIDMTWNLAISEKKSNANTELS